MIMTPEEFMHTQRGGRLFFLWEREKVQWKREEYQRMFNEELERINNPMGGVKENE